MSLYALVDCNNFFVSCERVFRPELTDVPVAVLSNNDGCIIARSNEVKALGVPMGIPLFKVRDIVRNHKVTLFSANFELYGDISQRIVALLREETPLIEMYSIDESFIDLSELQIPDLEAWARKLRTRIFREIGVLTSVGVAPTKTLAKVASTHAKTHGDGVSVAVTDEARKALLTDLAIEDIWGIGRRLAPSLHDRGVSTAIQLVNASDAWLRQQFTITGMKMVDELRGIARIPFGDKNDQRKSIMRSRSFGHKVRSYHQLESAIATFSAQAASRLRAQDSVCRGIIVVFTVQSGEKTSRMSHFVSLPEMTNDTARLISAGLEGLGVLFDDSYAYKKAGVILVGIIDRQAAQRALIGGEADPEARERLMTTLDGLNKRFGASTIWHASEDRQHMTWQSKRELRSPLYTTKISELPMLKI